jgi:hypothetical protein
MQAPDPQAVLGLPTETSAFLVLTVDAGAEDRFRDLLADVSPPLSSSTTHPDRRDHSGRRSHREKLDE